MGSRLQSSNQSGGGGEEMTRDVEKALITVCGERASRTALGLLAWAPGRLVAIRKIAAL